MSSLAERASRWGIEFEYDDAFGQRQVVAPEAIDRVLEILDKAGIDSPATPFTAAPGHTYQGDDPHSRMWVLAVQLYGVRSRRNWGHGDFTDLAALVELAADVGAAGIALNPVHMLFPDRPDDASPYSPNSRMFLNPLYIDIDAIPEFSRAQAEVL